MINRLAWPSVGVVGLPCHLQETIAHTLVPGRGGGGGGACVCVVCRVRVYVVCVCMCVVCDYVCVCVLRSVCGGTVNGDGKRLCGDVVMVVSGLTSIADTQPRLQTWGQSEGVE